MRSGNNKLWKDSLRSHSEGVLNVILRNPHFFNTDGEIVEDFEYYN